MQMLGVAFRRAVFNNRYRLWYRRAAADSRAAMRILSEFESAVVKNDRLPAYGADDGVGDVLQLENRHASAKVFRVGRVTYLFVL